MKAHTYHDNKIISNGIEFENVVLTKKVPTKKAFKTRPQGQQSASKCKDRKIHSISF